MDEDNILLQQHVSSHGLKGLPIISEWTHMITLGGSNLNASISD